MKQHYAKLAVILAGAALIALFFLLDLHRHLTLSELKARQDAVSAFQAGHPFTVGAAYMAVYIAVTALSLPGAAVMTLAGGALFGFWVGGVVVSFASSIGATLAFLVARFLLRDFVRKRFSGRLKPINDGIERDGAFYLFTLRLVPVFPFFIINLVMALTPIRTGLFYIVSQIGMLPATMVYVNAGTQLAGIDSLSGILSPGLILSFALLGIFPLIAKKTTDFLKARRGLARYPRPKTFDYNLVVIGAGSAGLVSAYIAATVKARVALIEKDKMGGDCLNTGCVPSKSLLRSAKILSYVKRAETFGFRRAAVDFDFADVMERVRRIISRIEPHDSAERYTGLGVDCIRGEARIISPYAVSVNGRTLTTKRSSWPPARAPSSPRFRG